MRERWAYRVTILALAERDVRLKYKQAVLGVAWAMRQPLAFLPIFGALPARYGFWTLAEAYGATSGVTKPPTSPTSRDVFRKWQRS